VLAHAQEFRTCTPDLEHKAPLREIREKGFPDLTVYKILRVITPPLVKKDDDGIPDFDAQ